MEESVKAVVLLWLCLHYCVSAKSFASNSDEDSSSLFDEQSKQLFGGNNRLPAWLNRLRNTLPSALTGRVRFGLFLLLSCSTFVLIFTTLVTPFSLSLHFFFVVLYPLLMTTRPQRQLAVRLLLLVRKRCLIGPSPAMLNSARAKLQEWLLTRMAIPLFYIVGRCRGQAGRQ